MAVAPGLFTKTERINSAKSLVCLLQALAGRTTTIELRNELTVHGTIAMVDSGMNTTVTNATVKKLNGDKTTCEELFLHGNQIRYVHIPSDIGDVDAVLETQVKGLLGEGGREATKRKRMSRARLNRQAEERAAVRAYRLGRGRGKGQGLH